jgi:hypothetical protein
MKKTISLLMVSTLVFAVSGFAQNATFTVGPGPGASYDFEAIQEAIDASVDGDTVLVAPGEYVITEPISFRGKAITVISEAEPDQTTIRMGTPVDLDRGSVVIFENNETAASVLDGFTITGGIGSRLWVPEESEFDWDGGAICFVNASSGSVRNCALVQNRTKDSGGGVLVYSGSSAHLTNCIISGNSTRDEAGGGVTSAHNSSVTMTDCIISGNLSGSAGGGVACWYGSLILTRCVIVDNVGQDYYGGGIYAGHGSVTLTNCVVARNTAPLGGGGVACSYPNASATVTNSIVCGNTSAKGREISLMNGGKLSIAYSNVAGGQARANVEGGSTLDWGPGNIDADPLFARLGYWADINDPNIIVEPDDPNAMWIDSDHHLKSEAGRWDPFGKAWILDDVTSPCIDRGDPNGPVVDEPDPNGSRINMGAYGGTPEASMSIGQLPPLPPPKPLAHWKLDETEGDVASDSVNGNDGTVYGNPIWRSTGGIVDGALQLDGVDDYISTGFILDPTMGAFSMFVWIKGGSPGQVVLSQTDGSDWLLTDTLEGNLMTDKGFGRGAKALLSQVNIADGNWHRLGFVRDGSNRTLYVDDFMVAEDTQTGLIDSYNGLNIGVGKNYAPNSYWSGLIDDVRIYNRAVIP